MESAPLPTVATQGRFELKRSLGHGGFGAVYAAWDSVRGVEVALKILTRASPEGMLRFKQEFRALSGLSHKNLVVLYDLFADVEPWFYTMELVDGESLLGDPSASVSSMAYAVEATYEFAANTAPPAAVRVAGPHGSVPHSTKLDRDLVRPLFRQLAEGLLALHREGRIHRDVKPSNVMVTHDGRVVILDFGLVAIADQVDVMRAGTPDYVAPEQIGGGARVESDWYSFGVMLYLALTGVLPFGGAPLEVLTARRAYDGPDPREREPDVPADLADLARDLMKRNPDERPAGDQVLSRLGGAPRIVRSAAFVGRRPEREAILEAVRAEDTVLTLVSGPSGIGKSATVHRALADLHDAAPPSLVLQGRCHERENVPFRALDGLIDALTRHLRTIPEADLYEGMPDHVGALVRLFPVLRQVPPYAAAAIAQAETPDPRESRRLATRALRELLEHLGTAQRLVLVIDDAQWGDADSASVLMELMRPPRPPRICLIACFRDSESAGPVPLALELLRKEPGIRGVHVVMGPLPDADARAIAQQICGDDDALVTAAVREAQGLPLFLDGLARAGGTTTSLAAAIAAQIDGLAPGARTLIEVLAVGGRPLTRAQLRLTARIGAAFESSLAALEAGRLAHARGVADRDLVEPWHDRVRDTVAESISDEITADYHRRLAEAVRITRDPDLAHLVLHLREAGEEDAAALIAVDAGDQAMDAMAIDHALQMYEQALDLGADPALVRPKLARALTSAGRVADAGAAWIAAAVAAPSERIGALRREAAASWLYAGHVAQGLPELISVLSALHLGYPSTQFGAMLMPAYERFRLDLRGLATAPRSEGDIDPRQLERVDACWAASTGLSVVDAARGAGFQAKHVRLALDAGEPRRVALGLCMEATYGSTRGRPDRDRSQELLARARAIARWRWDDTHLDAVLQLSEGLALYFSGRFTASVPLLARAEALLRERCTGVAWELNTARIFQADAARWAGEYMRVERLLQRSGREAEQGGNRHLAKYVASARAATLDPARDDPARGREGLAEAFRGDADTSAVQRFWRWNAEIELDLYERRAEPALARLRSEWPAFVASLLPRVAVVRVAALHQRARVRLAAAAHRKGLSRAALLALARLDARSLAGIPVDSGAGFAAQTRAGIALLEGDPSSAVTWLERAERTSRTAEGPIWASAQARTRGEIIGGDAGRAIVAESDAALTSRGVVVPERFARMLVPHA